MKAWQTLRLWLVFLLVLGVGIAATAQDDPLPDQVLATYPGFFPEGIEWDTAGNRFLLGSLTLGTIFEVMDDGTTTPFIEAENAIGSLGIHIDVERNRLLVANSDLAAMGDPENMGTAILGIYDLATGDSLATVDLGPVTPEGSTRFANDLTSDADGNVYLTNSAAPLIYKVDLEGNASILIEDERLAGDIGANGIESHPDGYLLVAVSGNFGEDENANLFLPGTGHLYKIPLDDPTAMTEVTLDQEIYADGLNWHPNGSLIFVGGYWNEDGIDSPGVFAVRSEDDWQTATVESQLHTEVYHSTGAIRGEDIYVVAPSFELMGSEPPPEEFAISRVVLE